MQKYKQCMLCVDHKFILTGFLRNLSIMFIMFANSSGCSLSYFGTIKLIVEVTDYYYRITDWFLACLSIIRRIPGNTQLHLVFRITLKSWEKWGNWRIKWTMHNALNFFLRNHSAIFCWLLELELIGWDLSTLAEYRSRSGKTWWKIQRRPLPRNLAIFNLLCRPLNLPGMNGKTQRNCELCIGHEIFIC